jgi:hypothetical protein
MKHRYGRWFGGALSALVAASGAALLVSGPARADISPGVGNAYAQAFQDTPKEGSLEVGVVLAEAIAGHTNYVARTQSQSVDLTAIGSSLKNYNCGSAPSAFQLGLVPEPLQVETGQPGAAQGQTVTPTDGLTTESQSQPVPPSWGGTEYGKATATPYGEADTSYADINVPGNPFEITGMKSKAFSGLVNGQREAGATVDVASLSLVNGMVKFAGLHWQVLYPSGGSARPTGSFSIGHLTINGAAVPTADPSAALNAANAVLNALGMQLVPPAVTTVQGVEFVSPLEINVVPNSTRDTILDAVVNGAQPVTSPVLGGLENGFTPSEPQPLVNALCNTDTPITVADIAVAGVDGAGSYTTALGGVNAISGNAPTNPFNLSLPSLGSSGSVSFVAGTPGVAGTSGTPGVTGSSTSGSLPTAAGSAPTASAEPSAQTASPPQALASASHAAAGPLLGIGLAGLAGLLLLAEGDRRLMRRARRGLDQFQD